MNFLPDWSRIWNAKEAEEDLVGFKFNGPGLYHFNGDTFIVIPVDRPIKDWWNQKWKPEENFILHVYTKRNPANEFKALLSEPLRTND